MVLELVWENFGRTANSVTPPVIQTCHIKWNNRCLSGVLGWHRVRPSISIWIFVNSHSMCESIDGVTNPTACTYIILYISVPPLPFSRVIPTDRKACNHQTARGSWLETDQLHVCQRALSHRSPGMNHGWFPFSVDYPPDENPEISRKSTSADATSLVLTATNPPLNELNGKWGFDKVFLVNCKLINRRLDIVPSLYSYWIVTVLWKVKMKTHVKTIYNRKNISSWVGWSWYYVRSYHQLTSRTSRKITRLFPFPEAICMSLRKSFF